MNLTSGLVVVALALGGAAAAGAESQNESAGGDEQAVNPPLVAEARQVTIAQALVMLNEETRDALIRGWPTDKSDFAVRKRLRVPNSELIRVLGMKLNNDPLAEGYVKWQLMSFAPDLRDLPAERVRSLLMFMPPLLEQPHPQAEPEPAPSGGGGSGLSVGAGLTSRRRVVYLGQEPVPGTRMTRPKVMVIGDGLSLSSSLREREQQLDEGRSSSLSIEAARRELSARREATERANDAAVRCRDIFVTLFPREGGARLAAMLRDAEDRIATGEPGYQHAIDRFIAEAEATFPQGDKRPTTAPAGEAMTPQARLALAEQVVRVARLRFDQAVSIDHAPGGGFEMRTKQIGFSPADLRRALKALGVELKNSDETSTEIDARVTPGKRGGPGR